MTKDAEKLQISSFDFLENPSEVANNIKQFLTLTDKSLSDLLSGFNQHQIARD